MSGTNALGFLPTDAPAPVNAVYVQVKINPDVLRENWEPKLAVRDAWTIPPFHLVFAAPPPRNTTNESLSEKRRRLDGVDIQVYESTPKMHPTRERYPIVMNAMTNMSGCNNQDVKLRCMGVSVDGVPYTPDMRKHPESCARISVAVAGVVTVACDRTDLKDASVGDTVYWTLEESDIQYEGYENHRSVKITTSTPHTDMTADKHFESGLDEPYSLTREEWLAQKRVLGTLLAFSEFHDECRVLLRL